MNSLTKGFVVKTKINAPSSDYPKGTKVFINLCSSPEIPAPPLCSKDEIITAVQEGDSKSYKVPMSLSSLRSDLDKQGKVCLVVDACIHTTPYQQAKEDAEFKLFIMDLAVSFIQQKHQISLDEELTLPKMKAKGNLEPHTIKRQKRPTIDEVLKKKTTPSFTILTEPKENPLYLVVQIHLPLTTSTKDSILDIESNRFIFSNDCYELDMPLAYVVDIDEAGAQFDIATRFLYVTMNVCPSK